MRRHKRRRRLRWLILAGLALLGAAPAEADSPVFNQKVLMPGVKVFQYKSSAIAQPNLVHVAEVDKSAPVEWKVVSLGIKTPVSDLCRLSHCLVGANAGFFKPNGQPVPGSNSQVQQLLGLSVPGIGPGTAILLKGGRSASFAPDGSFTDVRHPRTIVCDRPNSRLLVTVDGRQPGSRGINLDEASVLAKSLGCVWAVNFDGGGSTTLAVQGGKVVNHPVGTLVKRAGVVIAVDGVRRGDIVLKQYVPVPVANALVAVSKPQSAQVMAKTVAKPVMPVNAILGGKVAESALPQRLKARPASHHGSGSLKWLAAMSVLAAYFSGLTVQRQIKRKAGPPSGGSAFAFFKLS